MDHPANDNRPRHADSMTLADRRAWLASLPTWDGRQVTGWPTATRLLRAGRYEDIAALRAWNAQMAPVRYVAANDNYEDDEYDEDERRDPLSRDCTTEVRPTVEELALAWCRASYTRRADGGMEAAPAFTHTAVRTGSDVTFRLGDLRFRANGELAWWRRGAGRWLRPVERYRRPRGSRDAAVPAGESIDIHGDDFRYGEQEVEMARYLDGQRLRATMGDAATVLDAACSSATAETIAVDILAARPGKSAERRGVKLVDAAIKKFRNLVPSNARQAA